MEHLPKDVLILLALELDEPSISKLCGSSKRLNEIICDNQLFWKKKLEKERPGLIELISIRIWNNSPLNYKQIYKDLLEEKYSYSVKYITNPLQIYGVIEGLLEDYDFIEAKIEENFSIGDKVWVIIGNNDYVPKIYLTKKEAKYHILSVILQIMEFKYGDNPKNTTKHSNELEKTGYTSMGEFQFMMKEVTIL
jgi:hypothetical protein